MIMAPSGFAQSDKDMLNQMMTMMQVFEERQQRFFLKLNQVCSDSKQIINILNYWMPEIFGSMAQHYSDHENASDANVQFQGLYKQFQSILNELTPWNVHTIVNQVKELSINNPDQLNEFVDLIIKKAVDEPELCETYAKMCKSLSAAQFVQIDNAAYPDKNQTSFWRALLRNCQMRFEFREEIEAEHMNYKKQINDELEDCTDLKKLKELESQLKEDEEDFQMKAWGLFRFIGELFKLDMLNASIMHYYITNLLEKTEEEPLRSLCRLLMLIGKHYESRVETKAQELNPIMIRLSWLANGSRYISSRTKCMIQDLLDLWRNGWVPCHDNTKKTIDKKTPEINYLSPRNLENFNQSRCEEQKRSDGSGIIPDSSDSFDNKEDEIEEKANDCKTAKEDGADADNKEDGNSTKEEGKAMEVYNKVRSILHELTPEKLNSLARQIIHLPINNPAQLAGVVCLIINKAIDHPHLCETVAKMSKIISDSESISFEKENADRNQMNFRRVFLNCCQDQFELANKINVLHKEKLTKNQDAYTEPEKLKELNEEEKRKRRKRFSGLCRFIGELFKLDMFKTSTMYYFIIHLLRRTEDEPLESLCVLLTTIGKHYESRLGSRAQALDLIMDELTKLAGEMNKSSPPISLRVRFMIQNVLYLRANNWMPRCDNNTQNMNNERKMDQKPLKTNESVASARMKKSSDQAVLDERKKPSRRGVDKGGIDIETENRQSPKCLLKTSNKDGGSSSSTSKASSEQLRSGYSGDHNGVVSEPNSSAPNFHDLRFELSKILNAHRPEDALIPVQNWFKEKSGSGCHDHTLIRLLMTAVCKASIVGRRRKSQFRKDVFQKYFKLIKHFVNNKPNLEAHCLMAACWLMDYLQQPKDLALHFFQNLKEQGMSMKGFKTFYSGDKLDPPESDKDRRIRETVLRGTCSFWSSIPDISVNSDDDDDTEDDDDDDDKEDYSGEYDDEDEMLWNRVSKKNSRPSRAF